MILKLRVCFEFDPVWPAYCDAAEGFKSSGLRVDKSVGTLFSFRLLEVNPVEWRAILPRRTDANRMDHSISCFERDDEP